MNNVQPRPRSKADLCQYGRSVYLESAWLWKAPQYQLRLLMQSNYNPTKSTSSLVVKYLYHRIAGSKYANV